MSGASGVRPGMERLGCRGWHEPACPPKKLGFYSVDTEGRDTE